jgi:energy-coupling factor transport system permease protein
MNTNAPPLLDARAWLIWLLATAVSTMLIRNPLYLIIVLLAVQVVAVMCGGRGTAVRFSLWRIGLTILLFSTLFNFLFVHVGATVLWRWPLSWPYIGGAMTVEAAVFGVINGLVLLTLLATFLAFNTIVPVSDLVRLIPAAFRDLGVVLLIALTYVPETIEHWQRIREAQAIRGHQVKGIRDFRPIFIPLLIGGLERAMALAEAMVSRGYGATMTVERPLGTRLGLLAGLLLGLSGWLLSFWLGWWGWLLLGLGLALLVGLIWHMGRGVRRTHYQPWRWSWRETLVAGTAVLPLFALWRWGETAVYTPYFTITLPLFDPLLGLLLLAFIFPIFSDRK